MLHKVLSAILWICVLSATGQLQRKPLLGARVEYVSENGNSGCKVLQVVRGTSVELKLQENDIILKIGDK
jgi:hypothetical protein